jgi:hypothetical protein
MAKTRRETILATAEDLMSNFLYYDRKEDEDLPRGAIEAALESGEVTVDELLGIFRAALVQSEEQKR